MARNFGILKKKQDQKLAGFNLEAPMEDGRNDWPPDPDPYLPYDRLPWFFKIGSSIVLVVGFVFIAMAFILFACSARAHDYKHPEKQQWYESLKSADKSPCCDGKEASHIADMDWDTQCAPNNFGEAFCHYRVFLYNRWWDVPARAVVDGPNRDGSALVWEVPTKKDNEVISTFIRCFMPGAGG